MPIVTVPVTGKYGLILDQKPQELPLGAWSRAVNVRFSNGETSRMEGETQVFDAPVVTPYYLTFYQAGAVRYFVHAGTVGVYADDGTTRTNISPASPFTGTQDDRWSGDSFNGYLVMNNNKNAPHAWDGNVANDLTAIPAWPANTTAGFMRAFKNVLVAGDITLSGVRNQIRLKISDAAAPGSLPASWDHTDPTKIAFQTDLDRIGALIDAMPMGEAFIIYGERGMYAMTLGGEFYWNFTLLPGKDGLLARGCVCETPVGHVLLTPGDVVIHTGQGAKSIADGRVRRWIFDNIDSANRNRSFLVANIGRSEVWVCIPTAGMSVPNVALVWNWIDNTWTMRDLNAAAYAAVGQLEFTTGRTWAAQTEEWEEALGSWNTDPFSAASARLLLASTTPRISLADSGITFNGTTYESVAERTGEVFGQPGIGKFFNNIYPRLGGATGAQVKIELGGAMDVEQGPTYPASRTYAIGNTYQSDGEAYGRALAYRYTSIGNYFFSLKSFDAEFQPGGRY